MSKKIITTEDLIGIGLISLLVFLVSGLGVYIVTQNKANEQPQTDVTTVNKTLSNVLVVDPTIVKDEERRAVAEAELATRIDKDLNTTATHTIQSGETLGDIANQYGLSVSDITNKNNISNPNSIVVGQVLTLDTIASVPND